MICATITASRDRERNIPRCLGFVLVQHSRYYDLLEPFHVLGALTALRADLRHDEGALQGAYACPARRGGLCVATADAVWLCHMCHFLGGPAQRPNGLLRCLASPPTSHLYHRSSNMPMTIRYYENDVAERIPSTPPRTAPPLEPVDADDTIVLSDLLRSGEASRLRRRGALRLDHSGASISSGTSGRHHRRASASLSSPVLAGYGWRADPGAADDADGTWGWDTRGPAGGEASYDMGTLGALDGAAAEGPGADAVFELYCGGRDPEAEEEEEEFYEPSPLAWEDGPARSTSRRTRTNGCGALVHAHARPRMRCGAWTARCVASEVVVPLDATFFESSEGAKLVRDPCGCIREGIGCAAWYVFPPLLSEYRLALTMP